MSNQLTNQLGQKIGDAVPLFTPPPPPEFSALAGRYTSIKALGKEHFNDLHQAYARDQAGRNWTYLAYGPFATATEFSAYAAAHFLGRDPKFYTIFKDGQAAGLASLMRIDPKNGVIEIGHIHLSPLLQRQAAGTESLMLMIGWAFATGYRRVEWKCDNLNEPSHRAARRLGFRYEGLFRQAMMYKGRNRDTAWYAIIDRDFPALHAAWEKWLAPDNFMEGQERQKLSEVTAALG